MNRSASTAGAAALLVVLAACSSSKDSSSTTATPPTTGVTASTGSPTAASSGITIKGFAYAGTLTVKAGATVTVTNNDSAAHTLTDKATKKFDTGNIPGSGGTATFTAPTAPGSYPFVCTYHPNMSGTLVVTL